MRREPANSKVYRIAAWAVAIALGLMVWFERVPRPAPVDTRAERISRAISRAERFLVTTEVDGPFGLLVMDMLGRRHGWDGFDEPLPRFEARMARLTSVHNSDGPTLWRRIADRATPLDADALGRLVPTDLDYLTTSALYCDVIPLGTAWREVAYRALEDSDYHKTHVVLALLMAQDLGCPDPLDMASRNQAFDDLAYITRFREPGDVAIESAAFLGYLGEGYRVDEGFADAVLSAQLPDGGWAWEPWASREGNWHTTSLALWFLHDLIRAPHDSFVTRSEGRAPWTTSEP